MYLAYNWVTKIRGVRREIREHIIEDALREKLSGIWRRNTETFFKLYFNYMLSCIDCELVNWCSYAISSDIDCWSNSPNYADSPYHYEFSYCLVYFSWINPHTSHICF
ncbi:MAG: hypothetical protein LM589_04990 [Thermosphaera sp.]|nr:hypothetical protein [Thermosphaera sp.]